MKLRLNGSYLLALAIAAGIGWWMWQGEIVRGGRADSPNAEPPPAARSIERSADLFAVRVRTFTARSREAALEIRGRTEADTKVAVRVETGARVDEVLVREGDQVAEGDLLCRLDPGARRARLLQAEATLSQARQEYEANAKLNRKGFATETKVATLKAALDAAQAVLEEARQELDRTEVRAPVAGLVQSPLVEVGEVLATGGICATLIDVDPMLLIGQVSERDVGRLEVGAPATVSTVTGDRVTGAIRFIAHAADPETRTFRVEIEIANPERSIRDGLTASARVPLPSASAHLLSPGVLVLDDGGRLGVRTVTSEGVVAFMPVTILGDTGTSGVWVAGLPETVTVIVVGQDYVVDGQKVEAVFETAEVRS